jgi:hypothetical protein
MGTFTFSTTLSHPVETVFSWHTRPGALTRLTPPWEDVELLSTTGGIEDGDRVRLRMKRGPVDLTWEVEHRDYVENRQFVDVQVKGPFQSWVHTHRFSPSEGGGTVMEDVVEWEPPLGAATEFFATHLVEKEMRRAFAFRHRRLAHDLDLHAAFADQPRRTVAVTGASGLIGSALAALLTTGGHRVVRLVRRRDEVGDDAVYWNVREGEIDAAGLAERGVDSVVHLAGESISGLRWTAEKKRAIRDSRVEGTRLVARAIAGLHDVKTLVMASAVGYYGGRGEEILTEESGPGSGFLADVCQEWESAAQRAEGAGVRTVKIRNGVVLSSAGGALPVMLPPFKAGLGGRLGSGKQFMPWIDLDDCVGIFHHALMDEGVRGVLNGTAPNPVTNAVFTDAIGRVLNRPTVLPVPSMALKLALGEMGRELLLKGQRARPEAVLRAGYRYRFDGVEEALRHQLGRVEE